MGLSTVLRDGLTSLSQITGLTPGFTSAARCSLVVKSITFLSKCWYPGPMTLRSTSRPTLSSRSTGFSKRAPRARRIVVRCGCRFLSAGRASYEKHGIITNSKASNIPAAHLAFLAKFVKARGNRSASSAAVTPGPNQPLASMMALIMSCTTFNGAALNDNPYNASSQGTRIRWTSVAWVLFSK
jgi:hypothetical protein